MNITQLRAENLAAYRELMLCAYAATPEAFTSTAGERAAEPDAWWAKRIADPAGLAAAFGAFDGATLVGTVALEFSAKPKTRHKALVIGMYVHAAARRRGTARALMQAALDDCRRRDISVVQLTVTDGNDAALALYSSLGFRTFGMEPKAIRSGSVYSARRHMWLDLEGDNAA